MTCMEQGLPTIKLKLSVGEWQTEWGTHWIRLQRHCFGITLIMRFRRRGVTQKTVMFQVYRTL